MRTRVLTVRGRTTIVGAVRTGPQGPPGGGGGGGGDVDSVFGRTGAVVAEAGDYDVSQITDAVATDDPRLSDERTPLSHAATHAALGSDPITPAAIGAVPTSRTITAGAGLSGGGALDADRSLAVSFGTTAGTAAQGNDGRIPTSTEKSALQGTNGAPGNSNRYVTDSDARNTNARAPTAHADSHRPGGTDAIPTAAAVAITDSTNASGTGTELARADHVHAHGNRGGGSLHAVATESEAGFMSAADKDRLLRSKDSIVLFQDDFILAITNRWTSEVSGSGAAVTQIAAGGAYPGGRLSLATGSTSGGVSAIRPPINFFYSTGVQSLRFCAIVGHQALSDGTESYRTYACMVALSTLTSGFALMYEHTISPNWRLVRFAGGVVAEAQDTGVPAGAGSAPQYGEQRLEIIYTSAAGGTATAFIDGVQVAQLAGSFGAVSATMLYPCRIEKVAGTTSRFATVDYAYCVVTPEVGMRK